MADPPLTTAALTAVAVQMAMAGEPADRTAQVAERALAGMTAGGPWPEAVRVLVVTERYETAQRELARALEGTASDVACALGLRSELYLRTGDLPRALADAALSAHPLAAARVTEILVERGQAEGAAAPFAGGMPDVLLARGRLRLAQGRPAAAAGDLRECGRRAEASGILNPAALPWRSALAAALGPTAEAAGLIADELERARRFGAPRAIGIALCAAAGTSDVGLLREAVAVLDGSAARLERARAHARLGAALRRAGRPLDAREPLRLALDLAHRCGARALEEWALAELRAAGARPRRRLTTGAGALTPSERRIAELAAAGHQNREIAEALYLALTTVEYHLRHAYRKLGIASRAGLSAALETAPPAPA